MRFEQINNYYIQDKYTGKKYNLSETADLLNLYEKYLMEYKENERNKRIIK